MPKFQIILESEILLDDGELEDIFKQTILMFAKQDQTIIFKFLYAQNLEGIRKELWAKRDNLLIKDEFDGISKQDITQTFDDLNDIFKLT